MKRDWDVLAESLAADAVEAGEPTAWFERLYAAGAAGTVSTPWNRREPFGLLTAWSQGLDGSGKSAVVVGCGLGADAEYVASLGFATTAFDVSPTAVQQVRRRWPRSPVDYVVADLFALPSRWSQAFDLVVEIYTVQALPLAVRPRATAAVAGLVAPGGSLYVTQVVRDEAVTDPDGPPWPVTRAELDGFATGGVRTVSVDQVDGRWRAEFHRP